MRLASLIAVLCFVSVCLGGPETTYPTGDSGSDCTNCGPWPWNSACGFGAPEQIGPTHFYREYAGERGSQDCHQGYQNFPEEWVNYNFGTSATYQISGSLTWDEIGLSGSQSETTTDEHGVRRRNYCETPGCCIQPFHAYTRYQAIQFVKKLRIATAYYRYGNSSVPVYINYTDCIACNGSTRQLGVLNQFPSPELSSLPKPTPYDPPLWTHVDLCGP